MRKRQVARSASPRRKVTSAPRAARASSTKNVSSRPSPALGALDAGEGVHHGVEVGAHPEGVEIVVIADVHHDRERPRGNDGGERPRHAGTPDTTTRSTTVPILRYAPTDPRMPISMSAAPVHAPPLSVAVAVVARDPATVPATLSAVRRQAYGPSRITIVGGDKAGRQTADENETEWVSNLGGLLGAPRSGDHPRLDRPRPVPSPAPTPWVPCCRRRSATTSPPGSPGPSCSPSTDPDRLVSVGFATDVFDAPFTGIDDGEIDHGQYDVVRDVAAVGGASMLVRRDLLRGLQGPRPAARPDGGVHRPVPAGPAPRSTGRGGAVVGGAGARRPTHPDGVRTPGRSGRCSRCTARSPCCGRSLVRFLLGLLDADRRALPRALDVVRLGQGMGVERAAAALDRPGSDGRTR